MNQIDTTLERFTRTGDPNCGPLSIVLLYDQLQKTAEKHPDSLWRILPKRRDKTWEYSNKVNCFQIKKVFSTEILQAVSKNQNEMVSGLYHFMDTMVSELFFYIENSLFYGPKSLSSLAESAYDCNGFPLSENMIQEAGNSIVEGFGFPTHLYMSPEVYSDFMSGLLPRTRHKLINSNDMIIRELLTSAGNIRVCMMNDPIGVLTRGLPKAFLISIDSPVIEYREFFPAIMIKSGNEFTALYDGELILHSPQKQLRFMNIRDKNFEPISKITEVPVKTWMLTEEPENNNGRETCFWCHKPTVQKECFTSIYNFCESCGK